MPPKNKLQLQLQSIRQQQPSSLALTKQIAEINHNLKLIDGEPEPFMPPYDPLNFTLSSQFFHQNEPLNSQQYDLEDFHKQIKQSMLYDQVTQNNTISTYLEIDNLSPEFIDFASSRIEIISFTRMNEVIHRALHYEFAKDNFSIQTTQDLLVRQLNPLFDIETELMGDERAYIQKVQNRSQSRIDDVQIYLKFSELELQKEWKTEIQSEFEQKINIQKQFVQAQISTNKTQKMSKYKIQIKDIIQPRNWSGDNISNQILQKCTQNFRSITQILNEINNENPLNLTFKKYENIPKKAAVDLKVIQKKLIQGQNIRQEIPFDIEQFMNQSYEQQIEFRRKAIFSSIMTPEFNFLYSIGYQKFSGMELACELLMRTREIQLCLLLLQEINETCWYFTSSVFKLENFHHSSSEFHVVWNSNQILFKDAEEELDVALNQIVNADEQEYLFNLEKLVENKVQIKQLIHELFILMNRCNMYHSELVVFMAFIIRNPHIKINQNLTFYIQEITKYSLQDQRKYKYPSYYKNNIYTTIKLMLDQIYLYQQFDLKIEDVFASIIESARLELYYVYQFKNSQDSINSINSPFIQRLMLQVPSLFTAIQGGLKEIGSDITTVEYERTETEFDSFFNIQSNIQNYSVLNCFKEYGNQRFLQNLDSCEVYNSATFDFILNLSSYKAELPPNLVSAVFEYLTSLKNFLIQKFEFLLHSNIIPFRALNIRAQIDTFNLVISKYDYFSSSIDEIVQSNLPMTTSTVFLTQKDKSNIPKLFINQVYLLAFCQFVWSQENYYKARQSLISNFQIVEFDKFSQFDIVNFNFIQIKRKLDSKKQMFLVRNNLCRWLNIISSHHIVNVKLNLDMKDWFMAENMICPSCQSVATLKFDVFSEQLILVLIEWWRDIAFILEFKQYGLKKFGIDTDKNKLQESQTIIGKKTYRNDDIDRLSEELKEDLFSTIQIQEKLLNQRFNLIKEDSEVLTQKITSISEFLEEQLSFITTISAYDFSTSDGAEDLVKAMNFLKILKQQLFKEYITEHDLKLSEFMRFGLFQFNKRENFKIETINNTKLDQMLQTIEHIRIGSTFISTSENLPNLIYIQKYDFSQIQLILIRQWLRIYQIQPLQSIQENLELFNRFFLTKNKFANLKTYQTHSKSFLLQYKQSYTPSPHFTIPLPGVTGVMDIESTQNLHFIPRFDFFKHMPLRSLFKKLSRSAMKVGAGTEIGITTNYQLAIILQEFKRNLNFYFQNATFNLRDFQAQKDFYSVYFPPICKELCLNLTACATEFINKNISQQRKIQHILNLKETSKQLQINSFIQTTMQQNQTRIATLQMLIQTSQNLIPGQFSALNSLIQKIYVGLIFKINGKIMLKNEEINGLKDAIIQRVNDYISKRRLKSLQKLGSVVQQTVFKEIIQYDQELEIGQNQLREQTQRLRKYANLSEIRFTEQMLILTSVSQLEMSETNRFDVLTHHVGQINDLKADSTRQQIAELTSEMSAILQELESLYEQQRISQPTNSHKSSSLAQLAGKIAFPDKLQYDMLQLNQRLTDISGQIKSLKMGINGLKSDLIGETSQIEQQNIRNKQKVKQLKDKRNAVLQAVQAMTTAKAMLQKSIQEGVVQCEEEVKDSVVELGRKLQQERVICRREELKFRECVGIVREFEEEAEKRKNGLFL
ncbi:hypothetical protein SS50377_27423 [Spironucleus salmonicida]|uniref:Uncharacterized protein n=1 Tax=Spironucleus salmonicida TaxID=348837 RepID=V6LHV9_9EUKA|nr:hypothetical protein SS50377_27423 [Spironucleus salmonicida]|eukprot:EST43286.1 Hypothetical protein SS50377_16951 [Spironucleus salmonicida]